MSKKQITSNPISSNKEFKNIKFPARPFVQLIIPDKDGFIEVFNVPYNYIIDFRMEFGPTLTGLLTVLNPFPLSTEKTDFDRFKKIESAIQKMISRSYKKEEEIVEEVKEIGNCVRWGWCDAQGDYYMTPWNRIHVTNINISLGESGFEYKLDFADVSNGFMRQVGVDISYRGFDILAEVALYLYYNYNVILDFVDDDVNSKYKIFNYEASDSYYGAPKLKNGLADLNRSGFESRREIAGNSSDINSFMQLSQNKIVNSLNTLIETLSLRQEKKPQSEEKLERKHTLQLYSDARATIINSVDISKGINFDDTISELGIYRIPYNDEKKNYARYFLSFEYVNPSDEYNTEKDINKMKSVIKKNLAGSPWGHFSDIEKGNNNAIFKTVLNSRDSGIYRYYVGNDSKDSSTEAVQSNVMNLNIDIKVWFGILSSSQPNISVLSNFDHSHIESNYEKSATSTSLGSSGDQAVDATEGNIAKTASYKSISDKSTARGKIDLIGDPSISNGCYSINRKIFLIVYTPTGVVINGWTGWYHILGYSHSITEGKFITTLDVLLCPGHAYNISGYK